MPIPPETRLDALEFIAFDTETTGCAAASGRMVEIGALRFRSDGTELDRFQRLINPRRRIPKSVTRIHGITDAMVRDCPSEEDVLPEFVQFLGEPSSTVLMAHNAGFDMAFVGVALARCGFGPPEHDIIDTVRLSRRLAPELPSHSLRSLVRSFGFGTTTDHRGLSDSVDLMRIFLRLLSRAPTIETVGELFGVARPARLKAYGEIQSAPTSQRASRPGLRRDWWRASSLNGVTTGTQLDTEVSARRESRPPADLFPQEDSHANDAGADHDAAETLQAICGQLTASIAAGKAISMLYDGGRKAVNRRDVTPMKLVTVTNVAYLYAYCHLDRRQKVFRVDRVREIMCE